MAARFEYAQAEEIRDVFARNGVRYLFIGKSGLVARATLFQTGSKLRRGP